MSLYRGWVLSSAVCLAVVAMPLIPRGQPSPAAARGGVYTAMFGGDAQHTGRSPRRGPREQPAIVWRVRASRRVFASPVVTSDGLVVVGALDGSVQALDRDGVVRWGYWAAARLFASPAVVGTRTILGYDGGAYAALDDHGVRRWTYPTPDDADAPPVVGTDGTVYVASAAVAALGPDGRARWSTALHGHAFGAPALSRDERTMIVTDLSGAVGYYDAATGRLIQRWVAPAAVRGGALVLEDGAVIVGADDGHLRCARTDATLRWDVLLGSPRGNVGIRGTPALGRDGTVIVGTEDGAIHGVRASDGAEMFQVATLGPVRSSARIDADGWIYVGSEDDRVWALRPDGTLAWTATLGADVDTTPAIPVDGMLVAGCDDGGIYALAVHPPRER